MFKLIVLSALVALAAAYPDSQMSAADSDSQRSDVLYASDLTPATPVQDDDTAQPDAMPEKTMDPDHSVSVRVSQPAKGSPNRKTHVQVHVTKARQSTRARQMAARRISPVDPRHPAHRATMHKLLRVNNSPEGRMRMFSLLPNDLQMRLKNLEKSKRIGVVDCIIAAHRAGQRTAKTCVSRVLYGDRVHEAPVQARMAKVATPTNAVADGDRVHEAPVQARMAKVATPTNAVAAASKAPRRTHIQVQVSKPSASGTHRTVSIHVHKRGDNGVPQHVFSLHVTKPIHSKHKTHVRIHVTRPETAKKTTVNRATTVDRATAVSMTNAVASKPASHYYALRRLPAEIGRWITRLTAKVPDVRHYIFQCVARHCASDTSLDQLMVAKACVSHIYPPHVRAGPQPTRMFYAD